LGGEHPFRATDRRIATRDAKAPLPSRRTQKPTWAKAASLAREWRLNRLAERLDELAAH
jgi:DNA polymerase-1